MTVSAAPESAKTFLAFHQKSPIVDILVGHADAIAAGTLLFSGLNTNTVQALGSRQTRLPKNLRANTSLALDKPVTVDTIARLASPLEREWMAMNGFTWTGDDTLTASLRRWTRPIRVVPSIRAG